MADPEPGRRWPAYWDEDPEVAQHLIATFGSLEAAADAFDAERLRVGRGERDGEDAAGVFYAATPRRRRPGWWWWLAGWWSRWRMRRWRSADDDEAT